MQTCSTAFLNLCVFLFIFCGKSLDPNSILLEYACTEYALYYTGCLAINFTIFLKYSESLTSVTFQLTLWNQKIIYPADQCNVAQFN